MELAFGGLFRQIDEINGSMLKILEKGEERVLKIRIKIGGDHKSIAMLVGHGGASSKHYCSKCDAVKTTMKSWNTKCQHRTRTEFKLGQLNISKRPLITTLSPDDIVIPVNHLLTGTTKKAMTLLGKKLGEEATEWNEEKEERLQEITKSMSITSGGIEHIHHQKAQVMALREATGKIGSVRRTISSDICSNLCLYKIHNTAEPWDTIPCTTCDGSNHSHCARLSSSEIMNAPNLKSFQCLSCRGETKESLIEKDQQCIELLEENESELTEMMAELEAEHNELLRDVGRTSENLVAELEKMKISCGVYHRFYYADLIGEDARRLTRPENAQRLWNLIEDPETREQGVQLFECIHNIFKLLHTGYQSAEEISMFEDYIDRIQAHWSLLNPNETVTLKLHGFLHMAEAMRREGHAGREIELVEHVHHTLNVLLPKYVSVTPISRRLSIVINRFNSKRFLTL